MMYTRTTATRPSRGGSLSWSLILTSMLLAFPSAAPGIWAQSGSGNGSSQPKPPVRVRTQLEGFDLSPKAGKSANQVGGGSRDLGSPKLLAPNTGKSFTTNPEFHWAAAEPGAKVTFKLTNAEGQTLYETSTTAERLRYPGDAPALTPGATYHWTIVPENDMLGGSPQPVSVMIIGGEERQAILNDLRQANDASSTAEVFVKHRVWYDAIQGYSDLVVRLPTDANVRAARAELYDQLPVTKSLADADWRMVH